MHDLGIKNFLMYILPSLPFIARCSTSPAGMIGEFNSFSYPSIHSANQPASKYLTICSGQCSVLCAMEYQDEVDTNFILMDFKFDWENYKMCLMCNRRWYGPYENHGQRVKYLGVSVLIQYLVPSYLWRYLSNSIIASSKIYSQVKNLLYR